MFTLFTDPGGMSAIWSVVAFAIAAGVFWLARRQGPVLVSAWVAIGVFAAAGLLPVVGYLRTYAPYHVHVTVEGPPGVALDRAKVWSSVEGESRKVQDGWELDIPPLHLPQDRTLLVWAALDPKDITHAKAVPLRADHSPSVTIRITGSRDATVAGRVHNRDGVPIDGALVSRSDRGPDSVLTAEGGRFKLPVDTQAGDQIQIQVAFGGYLATDVWVTAGDQALDIALDRKQVAAGN